VRQRATLEVFLLLVSEDGPDLSESSDDANLPVDELNMYTEGSSILYARLTGFEVFLLSLGYGMAGGQDTGNTALGARTSAYEDGPHGEEGWLAGS
jgi:hypothetical protein